MSECATSAQLPVHYYWAVYAIPLRYMSIATDLCSTAFGLHVTSWQPKLCFDFRDVLYTGSSE